MGKSGCLNPVGVAEALAAVGRFVALSRAMEVERLDILATAAVRDASDGEDFVANWNAATASRVRCCRADRKPGGGHGVLCGTPDADGIVADLGGGSLELVTVQGGDFGDHVTMPLGVLRLAEASGDDRAKADEVITKHLRKVRFLEQGKGRALYAPSAAPGAPSPVSASPRPIIR